ncbi:single-stranded DNA-binding protein [Mariprofundus ferrooxydans]|nr:single-stranded DNA-binding protein [Mariprofundus ferrooxydans]
MLNKVMLIGNLGADPETRFTQDGTCVCNLRLATTEKFKGRDGNQQERTEWHRIVMWGRLGEIANQYLSKGSRVYIEGKIETQKWQDRDGKDQYTTQIRANEMKMLGGGSGSSNQGGGAQRQSGAYSNQAGGNQGSGNQAGGSFPSQGGGAAPAAKQSADPFASAPDFGDVPVDDDIPF